MAALPLPPRTPGSVDVVLDVCHNPAAFERLFEKLRHTYGAAASSATASSSSSSSPSSASTVPAHHLDVRAVVGFSSDKDFVACLRQLLHHCSTVHVVQADTPRAAEASHVMRVAEQHGTANILHTDVQRALEQNRLHTHACDLFTVRCLLACAYNSRSRTRVPCFPSGAAFTLALCHTATCAGRGISQHCLFGLVARGALLRHLLHHERRAPRARTTAPGGPRRGQRAVT